MEGDMKGKGVFVGGLEESAPAKINLDLHVTGRREDSYHFLDSLVVFVGARDGLQMHENKTWITFLEKSFPNSQIVSHLDADHDVCGVEEEVSELIIQWIMTF